MMDSLHAKGSPLLQLEAGNFMEGNARKGPLSNAYILDRMEAEGPAVITPGPRELGHWDRLQGLLEGRTVRLVSSNLFRQDSLGTHPLAPRVQIVDVGGVPVGVIGVLGEEEYGKVRVADDFILIFQDPLDAIAELAGPLGERADLVVVIACVNDADAKQLALQVTGVDVLISGHEAIACKEPFPVGQTLFNRTGIRGQHFSLVRLIVTPQGEIAAWGGSNVRLDGSVPSVEEITREIQQVEREQSRPSPLGSAAPAEPEAAAGGRFLGVDTCRRCHGAQYGQWLDTRHATAFATLEQDDKDRDRACFRCHVTGAGHVTGYRTADSSPDLRNVQCESCHGQGTEHRRGAQARPVRETTCRRCHTAEWSPNWDFESYAARVRHGHRGRDD